MINKKQLSLLNELADNPAEIKVVEDSRESMVIRAPEFDLTIMFSRYPNPETINGKKYSPVIEISFSVKGKVSTTGKGAGKKFRILTTVLHAIKKYLPIFLRGNDQAVYFTASAHEESRVSLYYQVAPKYISAILGSDWDYSSSLGLGEQVFAWVRKETNMLDEDEDYRGLHQAPGPDNGAPLSDLTGIYPDDIYGPNAAQYYGHFGGNHPLDRESIRKIQSLRGRPKRGISIFRAVPKGVKTINYGDWVTISRQYAKEHGEQSLDPGYRIITKIANAGDLYTDGNSIHEWGYFPNSQKPQQEIVSELDTNLVDQQPSSKTWEVKRDPNLPPSEVKFKRYGSKVELLATVDNSYTKYDDAEYAKDAVALVRTWMNVVIKELPLFVSEHDTSSVKMIAFGKRANIYVRYMDKILAALHEVNPGWVKNKPYKRPDGGVVLTFSNINYDRDPSDWRDKRTTVTEVASDTPEQKIVDTLQDAGYTMLGRGADASVWTKDSDMVIKIIMPDYTDDISTAARMFYRFYEFCQAHQEYECLPRFINISGRHHSTFTIDGREFIQIAMERLSPIPEDTFEEAMVWILSDCASEKMSWRQALSVIRNEDTWKHWTGLMYGEILHDLSMLSRKQVQEYAVLYSMMRLLYHTGRINKLGWDLHTENVMQRKDGTLVIIDPWFASETSE